MDLGILELVFSDPAAVHFMKGRNLAHWARDVEETREILEDFDFEFGELEQFLKEQFVKEEEKPAKAPKAGKEPKPAKEKAPKKKKSDDEEDEEEAEKDATAPSTAPQCVTRSRRAD